MQQHPMLKSMPQALCLKADPEKKLQRLSHSAEAVRQQKQFSLLTTVIRRHRRSPLQTRGTLCKIILHAGDY